MVFLSLLSPPKFSGVEVIWKDLLKKKKKKTTDTVFTFISEWRGLGLRSTGVPWWHRGYGQKKKSGAMIIFHRWFSIKPWFVQWWNKASATTLLVHFPGVYIRFEDVHSSYICSIVLGKIIISYKWARAWGFGIKTHHRVPALSPPSCANLGTSLNSLSCGVFIKWRR